MKPYLNVRRDSVDYGHFGDSPGEGVHTRHSSGYLYRYPDEWLIAAFVYQVGVEKFECASQWDTIPNNALWWAQGRHEWLHTHVLKSNLNFHNTPLEHRYNKSIHRGESDPQLNFLARNEHQMWMGSDKFFIPFKNPNPQGYQGVWASLDNRLISSWICMRVYDKHSPNHRLESNIDRN